MSKIKIMDEILANKIAAGEVVEKCVSVVKELVENSIDAEAKNIKIELKESGVSLIKVTDDGTGMDKEDAINSFGRHATSKIKNEEDLFRINTLGFRGEALASIASVSSISLITCEKEVGTIVNIKGGKLINVDNFQASKGTTVEVKNLFYNTPARLKHIKSLYSELAFIVDYINKISLSHTDIKFILINDDKVLLNTEGKSNLLKTISSIFGIDTAKKMIEIKGKNNDYEVNGYVSLPEVHKSSRSGMITLVNGRVVKNINLNRVINDSYFSYKPDNRFPIVVINIEVDSSLIDVNIHPTKMDIKFSKENELLDLITKLIKEKITTTTLIPQINLDEHVNKNEEIKFDFSVSDNTTKYSKVEEVIIDNEVTKENEKEILELNYVGIVHGTYIICQNDLGMYLIDQHAAKERINYEVVIKGLKNIKKDTIKLLVPLTIEYTTSEFIILKENIEFIKSLNFDIEEFGINSVIIKEVPNWLFDKNKDNQIKAILDLIIAKEKDFDIIKFYNNVAATIACKMSIKANHYITKEEATYLIKDLMKCDNPYNCPHGRPTIITYSTEDLENQFKRSGF